MYDDSYTEEQYMEGLVEGMYFRYVQTGFAFYKKHSHLTGFGVVKKSAKKLAGQLKYVTFGYDKCLKTTTRNQNKRVDFKARENCQVMNDGSCIVTKVILENNHELEPALSHFMPSHRELSRIVKKSLVAHDIVLHLAYLYQATRKAQGVTNYTPAKARFKAIIFESITITEFEDKWQAFIEKYDLGQRIWFQNLYLERSKWVPIFLKHFFWAGMMSTQRCESMHAFFDGYISGQSFLKYFVEQYEVALRFKYKKELESQARKIKQLGRPIIAFDWDVQIYGHYTHAIYDFFRVHVSRLPHCEIERHVHFDAVKGVKKSEGGSFTWKAPDPQINKNRSLHQYAFREDARKWRSRYYHVYEDGQSSQGRSGDGRQGRRGSR
ncbi:hypothetical protein FXO38_06455 [Capsicum annuum]|uniref:Protein FAR1-RELATED SEQUENCE n=1 Tax=Capsicum annuum TaxID=4072 RepID=A0A2G2YX41_CAPAN|nr:hypothetical protein FXO38_06455 [Capsicum annuum]KAF3674195.1 hypothetical protein FXO37_06518 [Capsicum annuum]PHT74327.1 hypothetical protein T459_21604 [Capsicum annuum]